MPVTAKLSRRFYEQFGDELANELVDWFNAVDATYRSDLRELNEVNFARFDAKLEQRFAEQDAKWERRFAEQDAKIEKRFAEQDAKWERRFAEQNAKSDVSFAELHATMASLKVDLVRWMFALWTGQLLALAAFVIAVVRLK